MSINTFSKASGVNRFFTGRALPLLAMAASIGLASGQTPFVISSVSSGQALDVPDFSKNSGALIQQYTPNGGTNQQFTLRRHAPNLAYEIVSVSSGLVLDVPGSSAKPGVEIQQYAANGGANQLWQFSRAAGATGYEIVSVDREQIDGPAGSLPSYANLVLDVPHASTVPGTVIQQYTENGGTNQQWLFSPQTVKNITLATNPGTIVIAGWGFQAGTEVCPVVQGAYGGVAPCTTVQSNGVGVSPMSETRQKLHNSRSMKNDRSFRPDNASLISDWDGGHRRKFSCGEKSRECFRSLGGFPGRGRLFPPSYPHASESRRCGPRAGTFYAGHGPPVRGHALRSLSDSFDSPRQQESPSWRTFVDRLPGRSCCESVVDNTNFRFLTANRLSSFINRSTRLWLIAIPWFRRTRVIRRTP